MINKNTFNFKYIILAIVVSSFNSFFYDSFIIMLILAILQSFILIKCFLTDKDVKYLCYYIIFLGTSMESAAFVGVDVFYGFKEFRVAGINLGALFLVLLFLKIIIKYSFSHPYKTKGNMGVFLKGVFTITPIALFMGLVNLLVNDNKVLDKITGLGMFVDASYIFVFVAIEVIVIYTIIHRNKDNIDEIKQCLLAIIISLAITLVTSLVFGNYGNRGGLPSLQVSNLIMLLICAILFPFYSLYSNRQKIILSIVAITILALGLLYNTNGKMIIIVMLIPIMILTMQFRKKMYKTMLFTCAAGTIIIIFSIKFIIPSMLSNSYLFSTKMDQALSMFMIGEKWLENMPSSPKIRISQFLNVTEEYFEKPWLFLTGKGYLGTIQDHLILFNNIDEFAYSKWQLDNELFYVLHESFNTLYLTNGLIGIVFFIWMFKIFASKFHRSPWLMIGGFWFILFYAYSITISIFGVTALIIGLLEVDLEDNPKTIT